MPKNIKRIFGEDIDVTDVKNPYQLYRRMRPYYFSDSKVALKMGRDQFEFIMSQLATNMKQDLFEEFSRQLVVRLITPNIIPSTGPAGHGDGGTDLETHAVAEDIAKFWLVPEGGCKNGEKWAFAMSCTSQWEQKIVRDVKKIINLGRDFTRIFFCTNQKVSSLKKSTFHDRFKKEYDIEVTILDYEWYEQAVFDNGCYNIAINALNLDKDLETVVEEGPNDKRHRKALQELDDKIASMQKVHMLNTDYVENLLDAAILERTISDGTNQSKMRVKSRFNNALVEAQSHGLSQQIFNIRYQMAWTEFYWNEDPEAMLDQYAIIKDLLHEEINPVRIEKATNLSNLMQTAITCHLFEGEINTAEDEKYWEDLYDQLKHDTQHTSSFLYLRIVRLERKIIESIHEEEHIDSMLNELKDALKEADHHLDISFESHMTILSALGELIPFNQVYEDVIDQLADVQARRESDIVAADTHYTRGMQNIYKGNYQSAIKHLGQCIAAYQKEPTRTNLVQACGMLGNAYSHIDLPICAKVFYIKALSLLVHQMNVEGTTSHLLVSLMYELCVLDIRLGQINDFLFWLHQMDFIIAACPHFNDETYAKNRMMLDAMVASVLVNTPSTTSGLGFLPSIFKNLYLSVSCDTLLHRLGYPEMVSSDFRQIIMTQDDWEEQMQNRTSDINILQPLIVADKKQTTIRTTVRGCNISASFRSTSYLYAYAELCLATIEAYMATMQLRDITFACSSINILLKEQYSGKTELKKGSSTNEYIIKINRTNIDSSREWDLALNLLGNILSRNSITNDFNELFKKMDEEEKLGLRLTVMHSHIFDFNNAILKEYPVCVDLWLDKNDKLYPNKNTSSNQKEKQYTGIQNNSIIADLIDYPLWDKAKWSGCGYIIDRMLSQPPIMILLYKNISYGIKIFEQWEKDFLSKKLNMKIIIITGVDITHPTWYKVLITPDMDKVLSKEDIKQHRYVVAASRFHLMQAVDDTNIRYLKQAYSYKKVIGLTAIAMEAGNQMSQDPKNRFQKIIPVRDVEFREAWTIGDNEVASTAILATDEPVIPAEHAEDAPVIQLLQRKKYEK